METSRDTSVQLPMIILKPGELHVADRPCLLMTVLGSCVAVCLHARQTATGAMCHAVFPGQDGGVRDERPFAFLDRALEYMISELRRAGSRHLEAKIFGGAEVLPFAGDPTATVGRQNVETARQLLRRHHIPVVAEKVGGMEGIKICFQPHTGRVRLQKI